jgi:hypothetical protein
MDGDLELSPRTLLELERRFAADPRLGIAGAVLTSVDAEGVPVRHRSPDAHVDGATKFYRRACFEEISPVPPILGWDTIDEACARMHGWRTRSFPVSGGVLHLRPMGTHDGLPRAFRRWGACAWAYGEPPAVVLLMALQRAADPPAVLGAANYLVGWAAAALRRAPRAKPEVRAFVRADQLGRLRRRLRGHVTRQAVAEAAP